MRALPSVLARVMRGGGGQDPSCLQTGGGQQDPSCLQTEGGGQQDPSCLQTSLLLRSCC